MKKAKPMAISMNAQQQEDLKALASKMGMSVSRVIHLMTIYLLHNADSVERIKALNVAFAGSALLSEDFLDFWGNGYDVRINEKGQEEVWLASAWRTKDDCVAILKLSNRWWERKTASEDTVDQQEQL